MATAQSIKEAFSTEIGLSTIDPAFCATLATATDAAELRTLAEVHGYLNLTEDQATALFGVTAIPVIEDAEPRTRKRKAS